MTEVKVDTARCIGCRTCLDTCFLSIIEWDDSRNIPYLKYGYDCQVCGVCETLCPAEAMLIVPDWKAKHQPRLLADLKCGGQTGGTV